MTTAQENSGPHLLGADRANAVKNDERVWRNTLDSSSDLFGIRENAGAGVDVGESQDLAAGGCQNCSIRQLGQKIYLVRFRLECLFDLANRRPVSKRSLQLINLGSVGLEALGEAVTKIAGVEDKRVLSGLNKVGRDHVPSESCRGQSMSR